MTGLTIRNTKPGTLDINVDATLDALRTQYQFHSDAIVPRASQDAPDMRQLGLIRDAHLNVYQILKAYKAAMQRESLLKKGLQEIRRACDVEGSGIAYLRIVADGTLTQAYPQEATHD